MKHPLPIALLVIALLLAVSPLVRRAGQSRSAPGEATTLTNAGPSQPPAEAAGPSPFRSLDIFLDTGTDSLAAYQFEFHAEGDVQLVGIEGGEHAAFREPPRYDPRALTLPQPRAIVAAFNTGDDLPTGKTRIARLMIRVGPGAEPKYHLTLNVAASSEAKRIDDASITFSEGATP